MFKTSYFTEILISKISLFIIGYAFRKIFDHKKE